jgi:hypothetical protein
VPTEHPYRGTAGPARAAPPAPGVHLAAAPRTTTLWRPAGRPPAAVVGAYTLTDNNPMGFRLGAAGRATATVAATPPAARHGFTKGDGRWSNGSGCCADCFGRHCCTSTTSSAVNVELFHAA